MNGKNLKPIIKPKRLPSIVKDQHSHFLGDQFNSTGSTLQDAMRQIEMSLGGSQSKARSKQSIKTDSKPSSIGLNQAKGIDPSVIGKVVRFIIIFLIFSGPITGLVGGTLSEVSNSNTFNGDTPSNSITTEPSEAPRFVQAQRGDTLVTPCFSIEAIEEAIAYDTQGCEVYAPSYNIVPARQIGSTDHPSYPLFLYTPNNTNVSAVLSGTTQEGQDWVLFRDTIFNSRSVLVDVRDLDIEVVDEEESADILRITISEGLTDTEAENLLSRLIFER